MFLQSPKNKKMASFILIGSLLLFSLSYAAIPKPPDKPLNYVTDLAGFFGEAGLGRLNGLLKELDQKTGVQIFVLTIKDLEGEAIESFSIKMAERWRPGQKGKDNGVLITVSIEDKRYRIEVGYGLEGLLPDSLVGSLGREHLVPAFRQGKYAEGLSALCNELTGIIAREYGVTIKGVSVSKRPLQKVKGDTGLTDILWMGLLGIVFLYLLIRHPDLLLLLLVSSLRGSGRWSGGGGFGGGGGGGFGGGGASGRW